MRDQQIGNAYQTRNKEKPYFSTQPLPGYNLSATVSGARKLHAAKCFPLSLSFFLPVMGPAMPLSGGEIGRVFKVTRKIKKC